MGRDGPLVTPEEFRRRQGPNYREKGVLPYCPFCGSEVHLYGVDTPNPEILRRFDHVDGVEDCPYSNACAGRYQGLLPKGWDFERGRQVRESFLSTEALIDGFRVVMQLCGSRACGMTKFTEMVRRGDARNIWAFVDLPVWAVPFVLLCLVDFEFADRTGITYPFHFYIKRLRGNGDRYPWDVDARCELRKVFSADGNLVRSDDNPYAITRDSALAQAARWGELDPGFAARLRQAVAFPWAGRG